MSVPADTDRIYLFVPPEEAADAEGRGALWDETTKRWYADSKQPLGALSPWLLSADEEREGLTTRSDQALVAETTVPCQACGAMISVICVHCESGTVFGDPLPPFTVSNIRGMDESLAHQLASWPNFRATHKLGDERTGFANFCPHCGARQDDMFLHTEPDHPFFDVAHADGSIRLTPLTGTVCLSGDEHFSLD